MEWVIANWDGILFAVTAVIAAASAVANITPTKKDDKVVGKIAKVVNALALNFKAGPK
jgi:hypothetical protein